MESVHAVGDWLQGPYGKYRPPFKVVAILAFGTEIFYDLKDGPGPTDRVAARHVDLWKSLSAREAKNLRARARRREKSWLKARTVPSH
jgi:hypothetical protein